MVKLLGGLLIFTSGCTALWRNFRNLRYEIAQLRGLISALETMGDTIRLERTPVPHLLMYISQNCDQSVRWFFESVAKELDLCASLPAAWRRAAQFWPPEIRKILDELADKLHGDEQQICKGLQLSCNCLTQVLKEREEHRREREQRCGALYLSAAALLIILLI